MTKWSSLLAAVARHWQDCARGETSAALSGRIPSLDGLRAISILMVVFSHCFGTAGFSFPVSLRSMGDVGLLGVRVFFVISGFLITTLLLKEISRTGTVSLRGFYIRRTLRIFPAFYVYLLVVLALHAAGIIQQHGNEILRAAFYTTTYNSGAQWTGQIWSLAVEEQFYILWPGILLLAGRAKALRYLLLVVLTVPVLRGALVFAPGLRLTLENTFPVVCDSIAWGGILAYGMPLIRRSWMPFLRSPWTPLIAATAVLVLNRVSSHPLLFGIAAEPLMNAAIALLIARSVLIREDGLYRLLNWRPLAIIGIGSYSIYLWQGLFVNHLAHNAWNAFPLNLLLSGIAAFLSYRLIEGPFLSLKDRFADAAHSAPAVAAQRATAGS